ncbi:MAG TPA: hypothetical protein DIV86_05770 [Alphaproteobacteria bacterium]|nr:hypothetical protein [Alphaproteobacteria bacterium]
MFNDYLEKFFRFGAKILARVLYSCEFEGFHNIPKTGAAIVIANHVSYVDGLVLNAASKRPMRFIIDADIYNTAGVNYFMKLDRAIPVSPTKDSVKKMLETVKEALDNGELIAIFPEGMITYTGNLNRFKFGIEWILQNNNVPVIPVALIGLWGSIFSRKYLDSKHKFLPRYFRKKVKVICGKPIPHSKAKIQYMQRELMKLISENI